MSDILPKPFTKEGLLQLLEKHLNHLKKHPNPTLDHIKDEDPHMQHHAHLQLHSPQKTHHSSSSTWTSSNSPQMPVTHQPTPSDASDHSQHYPLSSVSASLYAAATTPLLPPPPQQQQQAQMVNPNGITYVTPPGAGGAGPPQVVGQRRPLDLGDADLAGGGKRQQQTMFGLPGLQDMRSR
jgi:osomolarity two-component system response regulator SKN7